MTSRRDSAFDEQQAGDELAWATLTPRKHRHNWYRLVDGSAACLICQKPRDPAVSRRGLNNRKRGNSIELWVCKLLGIERVGQYGRIEDGGSDRDFLRVQVKSGGAHQASLLAKIHTIPVNADQLRGWVTVSTPGPGHPREGVISFDLREFAAWYGKGSDEEAA